MSTVSADRKKRWNTWNRSSRVNSGHWTWVPGNSSACSLPPSLLSSPFLAIFYLLLLRALCSFIKPLVFLSIVFWIPCTFWILILLRMCRGLVSLLFFWLLFSVICFLRCAEMFPLVNCWPPSRMRRWESPFLTPINCRVLPMCFNLSLSVFQASNWGPWSIWCGFWWRLMDLGLTSFFYMWIPNFPTFLIEYAVFSLVCIFGTFVKYDMAVVTFTHVCVVFCFVLSFPCHASTILALLL